MNDKVNKKVLAFSGICAIVFAVCALLIGILELAVAGMKNDLEFLEAGERWSSDGERFAVITMYSEDSSGVTADQAESWVNRIDTALLNSSVSPKHERARSWTYTYMAEDNLRITGPMSSCSAEVTAAGGDFFVFHQMQFKYGSPFLNDKSNPMGVVIDRDLAWKLFGAENIVGMTVTISDIEYTVVGVVEKESDSGTYSETYGDSPRMYMSYAGYIKAAGDGNHITMFETALPNAVKGFAMNIFTGAVSFNEDTAELIEATDRFSLANRFNNMKTLKYSWIRENKIEYPYWENEAKVCDYFSAVMMIFEVSLAAVCVSAFVVSFITFRMSGYTVTDSVKNIWHRVEPKIEKHRRNIKERIRKTKNKPVQRMKQIGSKPKE